MIDRLKDIIERGRGSGSIFARLAVGLKDACRRIVYGKRPTRNDPVLSAFTDGRVLINEMKFEVCSPCQNNCSYCTHAGIMQIDPGYQLSIPQLERFIAVTKESGYVIDTLRVHGPGEPTLWIHFNDGIRLLHRSGVVNRIIVTSNGLSLDRIDEDTWHFIDRLDVSYYPDNPPHLDAFRSRINILDAGRFSKTPDRRYSGTVPCFCICCGPMFYKDKIFLYCGPPVFLASQLMDIDIGSVKGLFVPLAVDYMRDFQQDRMGNLELCEGCWANANIYKRLEVHSQMGS